MNPHLKLTELSLSDIKQMLPPHFMKNVDRVNICGNYGDPANASEAVEIVKYLQTAGKDGSSNDKKKRFCTLLCLKRFQALSEHEHFETPTLEHR